MHLSNGESANWSLLKIHNVHFVASLVCENVTSFSFVFIQQEQMAHLFWWHSLLDIWTKNQTPFSKPLFILNIVDISFIVLRRGYMFSIEI